MGVTPGGVGRAGEFPVEQPWRVRKEMIDDVTYTATIIYARGGDDGHRGHGHRRLDGNARSTAPMQASVSLDRAVGISSDG